MQAIYVKYAAVTTVFFTLHEATSYGTKKLATGRSPTCYYRISTDAGATFSASAYAAATVSEPDSSTMPGVYMVILTTVVTTADIALLQLYDSSTTPSYFSEPVVLYTDNIPRGMDAVTADVTKVSGDANAADNLELAFDGTGYGIQPASNLTTIIIANDGITAAKIADDSITTDQVADGTITAAKIAADAITAAKIADDSITTDQLADGTITAAKIGADAITAAKIADNAIGADQIAADAIGEDQMADDAINADSIKDDAITKDKIADDAIGSDQLKDDAITAAKIAANAIGATQIASSAITDAKISATVNADITKISGSTTGVSGLQQAVSTVVEAEVASSGSSSTLIVSDTAALSSTDDAYVRRTLTFTSGALINQSSVISDYTGSSKTAQVSVAFTGTPANNDTFIIS